MIVKFIMAETDAKFLARATSLEMSLFLVYKQSIDTVASSRLIGCI